MSIFCDYKWVNSLKDDNDDDELIRALFCHPYLTISYNTAYYNHPLKNNSNSPSSFN